MELIEQKKAPVMGANQQGSCLAIKNHDKFDSNESVGLAIPEQPTRLAVKSARPTR